MAFATGEMDRRITIQTPTRTKNGLGNSEVTAWADVATRWASVRYGTGAERRDAAVEDNSLSVTFVTRWSSALAAIDADTSARIVFDETIYDIKSVAEIGRRNRLSFTAVTRYDAA